MSERSQASRASTDGEPRSTDGERTNAANPQTTGRHGRRRILTAIGATAGVALAGCLGGNDGADDEGQSLEDHPVGMDIDDRPRLGPDPFGATATIVTFEDPACPACASYHRGGIADVKAELVEPGTAALVARPFPGTGYARSEKAVAALEATFDHDEAAFWGLEDYYLRNQDDWDVDTVFERTGTWLDANTDLNGESVVTQAEAGDYDDRVEATMTVADEAGIDAHPTTVLFEEGTYVATLSGAQSLETITATLDL